MIDINRAMLVAVVDAIGDLRNDVVFCGGAIAGLLVTSPAGDPVRETDDVDCIIEIGSSVLEYQQIETRLHALGWQPGWMTVEGDPLCRFRKKSLVFDVMPTQPEVLGFAAQWAREAQRVNERRVVTPVVARPSAQIFGPFSGHRIQAPLPNDYGELLALAVTPLFVSGHGEPILPLRVPPPGYAASAASL